MTEEKGKKPYPLLTHTFIKYFISQHNLRNKTLLELGSGRSTIFWANYFRKVYSYESNPYGIQILKNEYGTLPKNVEINEPKNKYMHFFL